MIVQTAIGRSAAFLTIATVYSSTFAQAEELRLPCGETPDLHCVGRIAAKLKEPSGRSLLWHRLAIMLAVGGQTDLARLVVQPRLRGTARSQTLRVITAIAAARAGKIDAARAAVAKFKHKSLAVDVAIALRQAGAREAADNLVAQFANEYAVHTYIARKADSAALSGDLPGAMAAFRKMVVDVPDSAKQVLIEKVSDFAARIPREQRPKAYPQIAALLPKPKKNFRIYATKLVADLIALGATDKAVLILDRYRTAWLGTRAAARKPQGVKRAQLVAMAYLYARLGKLGAINHIRRVIDREKSYVLLSAYARAGDVATVDRLIADEPKAKYRQSMRAEAAPELRLAGRSKAAARLAAAYRKAAKPPGTDRYRLRSRAEIAAAGNEPLKVFAFAKTDRARRGLMIQLAEQYERAHAYRRMIALLQASETKTVGLRTLDVDVAYRVCSLVRHAAVAGKLKTARRLTAAFYRARAARGGADRASMAVAPVTCQIAGRDLAGALAILTHADFPETSRLKGLIGVVETLPR